MNKKDLRKGKIILAIITATILVAVFFLGLEFINKDKIAYGLKIANITIGGLTQELAQKRLVEYTEVFLDKEIIVIADGHEMKTTMRKLGVQIDHNSELHKISAVGREQNVILGLAKQSGALFNLINLDFAPGLDESKFNNYTKDFFSSVEKWPLDATVIYDFSGHQYVSTRENDGFIISRDELARYILPIVQKNKIEPIIINTHLMRAEIKSTETEKSRAEADLLLTKAPFKLMFEKNEWTVDRETLIYWIIFDKKDENGKKVLALNLDKEKIEEYLLNNITHQIDIPFQNAELAMQDEKVTLFVPSRSGRELDTKNSALAISDKIINSLNEAQNDNANQKEIKLIVTEKAAEITTASINNLGIRELLATGESDFAGSPKNRTHNIKVGAARFNGILIKPQEEFSFNTALGTVDETGGYKPELVIKQNKTVPEYGGGLCQVATTMFRAAVYSGLKITKRYPHAYPVKYYGTSGFDATIYPPNPDLKFINDTPGHILVQTKIKGTKLIFEFYGTNDGRITEVIGPVVTKKGADGSAEAYLTQKVTRNEEVIIDKTFYSKYRSPSLYPVSKRNPLE